MKLSKTVAYALHASMQLAKSGANDPIPCSRLATEGQMPERFLLQILRNLVTHGILGSTRGVDGGYTLERSPAELSLLDLIEAVDGPFDASLLFHEGLPEESRLKLECVMEKLTGIARQELNSVKLAHLMPPIH